MQLVSKQKQKLVNICSGKKESNKQNSKEKRIKYKKK